MMDVKITHLCILSLLDERRYRCDAQGDEKSIEIHRFFVATNRLYEANLKRWSAVTKNHFGIWLPGRRLDLDQRDAEQLSRKRPSRNARFPNLPDV